MDVSIDIVTWGRADGWAEGASVEIPVAMDRAAAAVDEHLASSTAEWLLFWDPLLGKPPSEVLRSLVANPTGDVWHAGLDLGLEGLPAEHDYIHPTSPFVLDPDPATGGICWRLSLGAALVRADALRAVGGLDPAFHGATGAGLELGRRLLERGAVVQASPDLVSLDGPRPGPFDEHDRFLFLRRTFGRKWVRYAALRRALSTRRPVRVAAGLRSSGVTHRTRAPIAAHLVERPSATFDEGASVSVVLPTLGRYELLGPLLTQLCEQTVAPLEILVVDQNDPQARDHELYASFAERGVRVIWQEVRGQWISRNAAIQESKGEYLLFVDDDSEIEPDFIAAHLEGLARYDADLTSGASLAVVGAPVPDNYRFFRVADQWDSGNGMCRRSLFDRMGLFDQQFDRQRRGDAEFGLRVQLAGGLVIHVPGGVRIHLKAEQGGLRSYGQWDGFRNKDRSGPLPVPSMLYYTARYHTPRQRREDLFLGLVQGIVPYHLKRRATAGQWLGFVVRELAHARSTRRRIARSKELAAAMVEQGPNIPALDE